MVTMHRWQSISLEGSRRVATLALAAFVLVALATGCRDTSAEEAAAAEGALAWLSLVDAGRYGESWDASASLFRGSITRDGWATSLATVREPLGGIVSRRVSVVDYSTEMPRAPEGEYVLIRFETSFENRPGTVERVTVAREEDEWRVSGYFIQ